MYEEGCFLDYILYISSSMMPIGLGNGGDGLVVQAVHPISHAFLGKIQFVQQDTTKVRLSPDSAILRIHNDAGLRGDRTSPFS